jgi:hypothetical protein
MNVTAVDSPQAMARVLALVLIADTELGPEEVLALDELNVCERLGISRAEFMDIARHFCAQLGQRMGPADTLRLSTRCWWTRCWPVSATPGCACWWPAWRQG